MERPEGGKGNGGEQPFSLAFMERTKVVKRGPKKSLRKKWKKGEVVRKRQCTYR